MKGSPLFKSLRFPALAAIVLAAPQLALAHAVLVDSTPKDGSLVHGPTLHVALKYNSRVDGPRCTLSIVGPDGNQQSLSIEGQSSPNEIDAEATGLHQGAYTLQWQALASDGHITRGAIRFRVA